MSYIPGRIRFVLVALLVAGLGWTLAAEVDAIGGARAVVLAVDIAGPYLDAGDNSSVAPNQECTYSAVVDGGAGGYTYQWRQRLNGGSGWQSLGTASSQAVTLDTTTMQLDVLVTDSESSQAGSIIKIIPEYPFNAC